MFLAKHMYSYVRSTTMTIIAIEEHWTTRELSIALKSLPESCGDPSLQLNEMDDHSVRLEDTGEARIAAMDQQGIDMHIISVAPPATGPLNPVDAVSFSRDLNDLAAEAVQRHPSRFRAISTLPMANPGAVAAELERASGLGCVGAMVYGRTSETPLDDPSYDDLFAAAERLDHPLFVHPQIPSSAIRQAAYAGFEAMTELALATFAWGWHVEAANAVLRLIARGIFDRYPDLKIVLGHWGEMLLFWIDRISSLTRVAGLEREVSDYLQSNVYFTCSGMFNPALLQHALSTTSIDQLLFSTDYPFQQPTHADIQQFLTAFDSVEDRHKFTVGNAHQLFGIADDLPRC